MNSDTKHGLFCPKCGSSVYKKGFHKYKNGEKKQRWKCADEDCGYKTVDPHTIDDLDEDAKALENLGKVSLKEEGNEAEINYRTDRNSFTEENEEPTRTIKSEEDLLRETDTSLDDFEIDRKLVNKWEVGTKNPDGTVRITELLQIKLWLKRKRPIKQEFPTPQPIRSEPTPQKFPAPSIFKRFETALIVPDSQNGFERDPFTGKLKPLHDRRAWDISVQISKKHQPNRVIYLGDMFDAAGFSDKYINKPEFLFTSQPTIYELNWWLNQHRSVNPRSKQDYLEGNHEVRVTNAFIKNIPESYNIRPADVQYYESVPHHSIPYWVGLENLGIEYHGTYPEGEVWLNEKLMAMHGETARKGSGATSRAILNEAKFSVIAGHIHRLEYIAHTTRMPFGMDTIYVFSPGTIAHLDGRVPAYSPRHNWQQALGWVEYQPDGELFKIYPIEIDYKQSAAIFLGEIYHGQTRTDEIRSDMAKKLEWAGAMI